VRCPERKTSLPMRLRKRLRTGKRTLRRLPGRDTFDTLSAAPLIPPISAGFGEHSFVGNPAGHTLAIEALEKWNNDASVAAEQLS